MEHHLICSTLFINFPDGIFVVEKSGKIIKANKAAALLLNSSVDLLIDRSLKSLFQNPESISLSDVLTKDEKRELHYKQDNEGSFYGETRAIGIFNDASELEGYIVIVKDISQKKAYIEEIQKLAITDGLTSLFNQSYFQLRLKEYVSLAKRENLALSLMYIDVDRFKDVNDTYGHPVGDELLAYIATVLTNCCRKTDLVARVGGDEFGILLINPDKSYTAELLAKRVLRDVNYSTINLTNCSIKTSVSIGISHFPKDAQELDLLIKYADNALYRSKDKSINKKQAAFKNRHLL